MAKPKRELLKFRTGDFGLKIRKDGKLEVAGISEESPMIDNKGMVNPVLLFAAAWARKDQKCFEALVTNFKASVKEGYFGPDAQRDFERALKVQEEEVKKPSISSAPFLNPDSKPTIPATKPTVSASVKLQDAASGAVTFEQPEPLDVKGVIDRRDS